MRFTLKDNGYPYKSIMQGRKQVGRVYKDADGMFVGMIGKDQSKGHSDEVNAFRAVASKALGFEDADAVRAHNAVMRERSKVARQQANAEFAGFMGPELMGLLRALRK